MFVLPHQWVSQTIRVVLAGAGGSGSEMLDGLARIDRAIRALGHPGLRMSVYDPDTVSETNTVRQRFWPADVGQNKAELLMHRYGTFGGLAGRGFASPVTADLLAASGGFDLLVTCVDKAAVRAQIGAFDWMAKGWPFREALWLDLGNGARSGQVVLGHLTGWQGIPERLPNVLDLFPELRDAERLDADDAPSCSAAEALAAQDLFINRWVAVAACDLLWQLVRRGRISANGFFINPTGTRVSELAIDARTRASFGLVAWREAA
ncbi:PRTRC system ThiF family protein [Lamprocystis purpurea]|uniref:PRTRC system ThiF family protein n=1 Tax=Lamprocystis purpurea TaxID=61598 RepID=UPI000368A437|nr:PRTRC system ThiF family protein [Lamprocystis purpurea]